MIAGKSPHPIGRDEGSGGRESSGSAARTGLQPLQPGRTRPDSLAITTRWASRAPSQPILPVGRDHPSPPVESSTGGKESRRRSRGGKVHGVVIQGGQS